MADNRVSEYGRKWNVKVPRAELTSYVNRQHVSLPRRELAETIRRQCEKQRDASPDAGWTEAIIDQAVSYAVIVHERNIKLYRRVSSGRF